MSDDEITPSDSIGTLCSSVDENVTSATETSSRGINVSHSGDDLITKDGLPSTAEPLATDTNGLGRGAETSEQKYYVRNSSDEEDDECDDNDSCPTLKKPPTVPSLSATLCNSNNAKHARHSSLGNGPSYLLLNSEQSPVVASKTQHGVISNGLILTVGPSGSPGFGSFGAKAGVTAANGRLQNNLAAASNGCNGSSGGLGRSSSVRSTVDATSFSSSNLSSLSVYSDSVVSDEGRSSKVCSLDRRSQLSLDLISNGSLGEASVDSGCPPASANPDGTLDNASIASGEAASNKRRLATYLPKSLLSWIQSKSLKPDVSSTSCLILEGRPSGLPAKPPCEDIKHKQQYGQIVEAAKKREQKEAKLKKRKAEAELKKEEARSAAVKEWNTNILPNWSNLRHSKKTLDLWWQGLPPSVRGRVWILAIGNDLNITQELYEICVARAKERLTNFDSQTEMARDPASSTHRSEPNSPLRLQASAPPSSNHRDQESTVELIHLDVSRTFPHLGIFQQGGPYHDLLLNLLGAYVCYRPDVGYVQGMSFVAAVLLLNLDASDAFVAFANLLNRPCPHALFRLDQTRMAQYFSAYDAYFRATLPHLASHFAALNVAPQLYLIEWLYTLYAKSLPLDVACRVWDMFFRDGEDFLFRTAIGLLSLCSDVMMQSDFDQLVALLTHIPDSLCSQSLLARIEKCLLSLYSDVMMQLDFDQLVAFLTHIPDSLCSQSLFARIEKLSSARSGTRFSSHLAAAAATVEQQASSPNSAANGQFPLAVTAGASTQLL